MATARRSYRGALGVAASAAAILALSALDVGVASAAAARPLEGSFSSYLKDVQPKYESRSWDDLGLDGNSTHVYLAGCTVHAGGKPNSPTVPTVAITLYYQGKSRTITHQCGTYDFGVLKGAAYNTSFEVASINGNTSKDNRKTFLSATTANVYY